MCLVIVLHKMCETGLVKDLEQYGKEVKWSLSSKVVFFFLQ